MRITRTKEAVAAETSRRAKANAGCEKCPCCGEERDHFEMIGAGEPDKGVDKMQLTRYAGWFSLHVAHVDWYQCYTCGAEWESDPY